MHYRSTLVGYSEGIRSVVVGVGGGGGGWTEKPTYLTAYLQPCKVKTDTGQMTAKYGYTNL